MKKLFFLAVLLLGITVTAQNSKVENNSNLTFESETIDYGIVAQNSNGKRDFKVTNVGDTPIVISKVKTSCGCTVPSKPKDPILPGQSATISVNYDTKRLGKFTKTVTVYSNGKLAAKQLRIKGEVIKKDALVSK